MSLQDGRELLERAKAEYRRALRVVDSRLKAAVAQDPSRLDEARQIQGDYSTGFSALKLSEMFQPDPPPKDEHGADIYPEAGPASGPAPEQVDVTPAPVQELG